MNKNELIGQIKDLFNKKQVVAFYDRPSKSIVAKAFYGDNYGMKSKEDVKQYFNSLVTLFQKFGEIFDENSISFLDNGTDHANMVFRFSNNSMGEYFRKNIVDVYEDVDLDFVYEDSVVVGDELVIERQKFALFLDFMFSHIKGLENKRNAVCEHFDVDNHFLDWCYGKSKKLDEDSETIVCEDGIIWLEEFRIMKDCAVSEKSGLTIVVSEGSDELHEALKRKVIVRGGKKKRVKRSTKKGYTTRGGKEVKMSSKERRNRRKSQKKAARKRKSKKSASLRKRKRSMRKRRNM